MRLRVATTILLTAVAYFAIALTWRQVFPFRDGIIEYVPEGTIAYVHVNLTPAIRRHIEFQISLLRQGFEGRADFRFQIGESLADALATAVRSLDVRELGFIWYPAFAEGFGGQATPEKGPGPFSGTSELALVIGQRSSPRPDVLSSTTVMVGDAAVHTIVVRTGAMTNAGPILERTLVALRNEPVQALVRPSRLPIPALDAARHLFPETITASGTIGTRRFILRSDGRLPMFASSPSIPLLAESQSGTLQIIGLPVRAIVEQLDLPFHGELRAAIEPSMPATADLLIDRGRIAVRMDAPAIQPSEDVLRSLAARIWPSVEPRRLDGLTATVQVADPNEFEVASMGANRWTLRSRGNRAPFVVVERSGHSALLSTHDALLDRIRESRNKIITIPSPCRLNDQPIFLVWPLHPQVIVTLSVAQDSPSFTLCGRTE